MTDQDAALLEERLALVAALLLQCRRHVPPELAEQITTLLMAPSPRKKRLITP